MFGAVHGIARCAQVPDAVRGFASEPMRVLFLAKSAPQGGSLFAISPTEIFFIVIGSLLTLLVLGLFAGIIIMAVREKPEDVPGGAAQPRHRDGDEPRS